MKQCKFPITLSFRAEDAVLMRFEVLAAASFIQHALAQGHAKADVARFLACVGMSKLEVCSVVHLQSQQAHGEHCGAHPEAQGERDQRLLGYFLRAAHRRGGAHFPVLFSDDRAARRCPRSARRYWASSLVMCTGIYERLSDKATKKWRVDFLNLVRCATTPTSSTTPWT